MSLLPIFDKPISKWQFKDVWNSSPAGLVTRGIGEIGNLFKKGYDQPKQTYGPEDIDKMISAYRESGLSGLRSLAESERNASVARLASLGMELTPSMQQALFNPIFAKLSEARTGFEGSLAGVESGALQHYSDVQAGLDQEQIDKYYYVIQNIIDTLGSFAAGKYSGGNIGSGYGGY